MKTKIMFEVNVNGKQNLLNGIYALDVLYSRFLLVKTLYTCMWQDLGYTHLYGKVSVQC